MRRVLVCFALVLHAALASGQTFRGGIQGTVIDETGAALPGSTVTATNVSTGLTRTVGTDNAGNYFLSELPIGQYDVTATLAGFTTQTVKGVEVAASTNQRVNLTLRPGGVEETVEVQARAPLVDTTRNTQGGTIEGAQAAEIPLNGRDFVKLLTLVPGSAADPSGINDSPGSFGLFSMNGNRGRSNNYLLDGTDMNDGSIQAGRRVTFNWGVRWDYDGVIGERDGRFSVFDTATASVVQTSQLYDKDWNNFSPRASVAWDLTGEGRRVLRAGYGLYYDAFSQDFFVGQLPWNTFNPGPAYNDIQFSFSPVDQIVTGQPVFADDSFSASDVFTVDRKLRTPYVQIYNVNLQQELGNRAAIEVGYVGSLGRSLFRYVDINQVDPATGTSPYPDFVYINRFESTARSRYNSLQATLKLRDWHGVTSTVNYTLSKSMDTASDGQDYVPNAAQPDNSLDPEAEWAASNFDVRHRFTWYFTWTLPPGSGGRLVSGWSLSGVVTLAGGQPFNINYLFENDFNGSGEYFGRPDLVGDPYAGTGGPTAFLNLSAFAAPCAPDGAGGCAGGQHFGSLPRNAFRGPDFRNVDLSIAKTTPLSGRAKLQLRMDVFNLFNRANFSNPMLPNFSIDFLQNGIDPATNRGTGFLPLTATPDVGGGNPFLGGGGPRAAQLAARVTF